MWFLLWVDEIVDGAHVGDLHCAVTVGGEGDGVGLCSLRHGDDGDDDEGGC